MKRENPLKSKTKVAILSAALNVDGDGWYQLLPAGKFKARDGRPFDTKDGYWFIDENIAQQFIAQTIEECKGQKILIDYDHQTLHRDETGQKALAAGWIINPANDIAWREDGLYIRPRWTPVTQSEIDNEQWGSFSAVFPYDENGHPLYLRMAAITNDPGLVEIQSLVALAAELFNENQPSTQETTIMNDALKSLLILLGVLPSDDSIELTDENATELAEQAVEKINTLLTAAQAAVDVTEVIQSPEGTEQTIVDVSDIVTDSVDEIAEAEAIVQEATLNGIDLTRAVPVSAYRRLAARCTALSANHGNSSVEMMLLQGKKQGRVTAANAAYLRAIGRTSGIAALSAAINAIPPIRALIGKQTRTLAQPSKGRTAVLSASEKEAARLLGIPESEYLKRKGSK